MCFRKITVSGNVEDCHGGWETGAGSRAEAVAGKETRWETEDSSRQRGGRLA